MNKLDRLLVLLGIGIGFVTAGVLLLIVTAAQARADLPSALGEPPLGGVITPTYTPLTYRPAAQCYQDSDCSRDEACVTAGNLNNGVCVTKVQQ